MSHLPSKSPPKRPIEPAFSVSNNLPTSSLAESSKRRKLSDDSDELQLRPVPFKAHSPLPNLPLLYHLALSAHKASTYHLQQSFIPSYINTAPSSHPPITIPDPYTSTQRPFTHDAQASKKSHDLLILALDSLKTGLKVSGISDKEVAYFGYEFGIIGLKVYMSALRSEEEASNAKVKGKEVARTSGVESKILMGDMLDVVSRALVAASRTPNLRVKRQQLEVLNARLAFIQGKGNLGARIARQSLNGAGMDDVAHRYTIFFLLLEFADGATQIDALHTMNEFEREAEARGHLQIIQHIRLARIRHLFAQRKYDRLPSALADAVLSLEKASTSSNASISNQVAWDTALKISLNLLRCLWEGRVGNDNIVKGILKETYGVMDDVCENGVFKEWRRTGGVVTIELRPSSISSMPPQSLNVQITPPNILYLLTYLTSVVSRRDYTGSHKLCKTLIHARAMKESEDVARAEEMWDVGFSHMHGLEDVEQLRLEVLMIRAEMMIEEATCLIFRTNIEEADAHITRTITFLRTHNLFTTLSPSLTLLHAQYAHLLGNMTAAKRYYEVANSLITPGSELGLVIEVGLRAAVGGLEGLLDGNVDHSVVREVGELVDRCRRSGSCVISAGGWFLASLIDPNRVNSKKSLSTAYEIAQKANNHLLKCLIFAFTTSSHLYGNKERTMRQLETGRDLSTLLGGKDRADGVGLVTLGLWFWLKLKDEYRQQGDKELETESRSHVTAHLKRLDELSLIAKTRFPG